MSKGLRDKAVRVARYVKDHHSSDKFEETFLALVSGYWSKGIDISTSVGIVKALEAVFSPEELEHVMQESVQSANKKRVIDTTMAVGAFGAPWITAINAHGEKRDWFGNDRWHQVFHHLGSPFTHLAIKRLSTEKANL